MPIIFYVSQIRRGIRSRSTGSSITRSSPHSPLRPREFCPSSLDRKSNSIENRPPSVHADVYAAWTDGARFSIEFDFRSRERAFTKFRNHTKLALVKRGDSRDRVTREIGGFPISHSPVRQKAISNCRLPVPPGNFKAGLK